MDKTNSTKYKIYPRGFFGSVQSPTVQKTSTSSEQSGRFHYDVTLFDSNKSKTITANMEIDSLYRNLVRQGKLTFNEREKILKAALSAFGTKDIYEWYRAQFSSPVFGYRNRKFLDDLFKFILTGRRALPLQNWNSLVGADESNPHDKSLTDNAQIYFGCSSIEDNPLRHITLQEFIQDWISKEGGYNDLIFTLYILFGVTD